MKVYWKQHGYRPRVGKRQTRIEKMNWKRNWLGHCLYRDFLLRNAIEDIVEEKIGEERPYFLEVFKLNRMLRQTGKRKIEVKGDGLICLEGPATFDRIVSMMIRVCTIRITFFVSTFPTYSVPAADWPTTQGTTFFKNRLKRNSFPITTRVWMRLREYMKK